MPNDYIQPLDFKRKEIKPEKSRKRLFTTVGLLVLLFALLLFGGYVLLSQQIALLIEPDPDSIRIHQGFPAIRVGENYLMLPGKYEIQARKKGYFDLQETIDVSKEKNQTYAFQLNPLPGILYLNSAPVNKADVFINGQHVGNTPLGPIEQEMGEIQIKLQKEEYLSSITNIFVKGKQIEQSFELQLTPSWAKISLNTFPTGAFVNIDNETLGKTPLDIELFQGEYALDISLIGHETFSTQLQVFANQPFQLQVPMEIERGRLLLNTIPQGANVQINEHFEGQTPLDTKLASGKVYNISLFKAGYEMTNFVVQIKPGEEMQKTLLLIAQTNRVQFISKPPGAAVVKDKKVLGNTPLEIDLPTIPQEIHFRLEGYSPATREILPRKGPPQIIKVELIPLIGLPATILSIPRTNHTAANGYKLVYVKPSLFTMGSSRREIGRRSNETKVDVELTRPFYMGSTEVTNKEFREFDPSHDSGRFRGITQNKESQAVVHVSWEQAVAFCNWLSRKDGIKPAYVKKMNKWTFENNTGYRLPTEGEWEYCARFHSGKSENKFPWGNVFPPPEKVGNFADVSGQMYLDVTLPKYRDGYAVSGRVRQYAPNALGLYDMGGNVAEWCHDYYSIFSQPSGGVLKNPTGPNNGHHHVIRGSSWRHATQTHLRCSFRDYGESPRNDLGFRICRYVN